MIRGGDHLAVDLIGALRLDHVDQFLDHVDIGRLDIALSQGARAVLAGNGLVGRPGGVRLDIQVLPHALQAGRVQKSGQLQLAHLDTGGAASLDHRHRAIERDGHAGGVLRQCDGGLHRVTAGGHQLAVLVGLKRTVAGVGGAAVGHQDLEKAVAADGHVLGVVGFGGVAVGVDALAGHHAHTGTHLQARGQTRLVRGLAAGLAQVLVHQVFKHGATALEASGAHVGQVVGHHVKLGLLRVKTCLGNVQGTNHGKTPG